MVTPGSAALCPGRVLHRRNAPADHTFTRPVSMVWIDPDDPAELFGRSPLFSSRRPAPIRFRASDYGTDDAPVGSAGVRDELEAVLGQRPDGPVRMLSQPRRWGWLFNPFTLYLAWNDAEDGPVGAVVEVTNTPWKERHRYALALPRNGAELRTSFDKELHVSPFLGENHQYDLRLGTVGDQLTVELNVMGPGGTPVVETRLEVGRLAPTPAAMRRFVTHNPLATHRVSAGIHLEAAKLWAKRVPFIPHPKRNERPVARPVDTIGMSPR